MKKYKKVNEKQELILQLISMGIKVTATNGEIHELEFDETQHNIKDIEQLTGLKFKEK
jgi:hypothetical protein